MYSLAFRCPNAQRPLFCHYFVCERHMRTGVCCVLLVLPLNCSVLRSLPALLAGEPQLLRSFSSKPTACCLMKENSTSEVVETSTGTSVEGKVRKLEEASASALFLSLTVFIDTFEPTARHSGAPSRAAL
jgi:hypothetical protein